MNREDNHPRYPNPTIMEALCEIHFTYPLDADWRATRPSELFKLIQEDFPIMEPRVDFGLQLQQGAGATALPIRQRIAFRHGDRPLMLQLGENLFTVNELAPYPGWKMMAKDVLDYWKKAAEVLKPVLVGRVGLRYINHIPRSSKGETVGNWLAPGRFIPEGVLASQPGFLSRVKVQRDKESRVIVTVAERAPDEEDTRAIVFDIDEISESEMDPGPEVLGSTIEKLHDRVWEIFESSQTRRLRDLLSTKPEK